MLIHLKTPSGTPVIAEHPDDTTELQLFTGYRPVRPGPIADHSHSMDGGRAYVFVGTDVCWRCRLSRGESVGVGISN